MANRTDRLEVVVPVRTPMWVTTFLDADEMVKRYGAGISRRLYEDRKIIRVRSVMPVPPQAATERRRDGND